MFNQVLLPINFNIQFKTFLSKSGYGAFCLPFPHAPIPYVHADETVWMKTEDFGATWPFERVMSNLPDISYETLR